MNETTPPSFSCSNQFYVAVLFVAVLLLPGIVTVADILSGPDTIRQESVAKTPDVKLDFSSFIKFPGDFRYYIKRRFGFKEMLVTLNSELKEGVFGISPYPNVILGKEEFLFLGVPEAIDFTQGVALFDDKELKLWNDTIRDNAKGIERLGSRYELVLTPNKHTVYPDKLPDWTNVSVVQKTRTDQLMEKARKNGLPVHDLRGALKQRRDTSNTPILYYKTDTHWNEYGAGLGVNYLLSEVGLAKQLEVQPKFHDATRAGDLARMIGQQHRLVETPWSLDIRDIPICEYEDGKNFVRNQTDPIKFNELHCNNLSAPDVTAIIFIDSFGVSMIPSFSVAFREVTFLWQYTIDRSLIEHVKPDYVIHQITERKLQTLNPRNF